MGGLGIAAVAGLAIGATRMRRLRPLLTPERMTLLDSLLVAEEDQGKTQLSRFRQPANSNTPTALLSTLGKFATLQSWHVDAWEMSVLNPNRQKFLARLGRSNEAIALANRALQLDPVSPFVNANLASVFYFGHQYDRLIDQANKMLDMDRNSTQAHAWLGYGYLQKGLYEQALPEMQRAFDSQTADGLAQLGYAYAVAGRKSEALKALAGLQLLSERKYVSPVRIARIYVGLGDRERAFEWLEKGYAGRSDHLTQLKTDPTFDSLRSDPRFADLLRRVRLPK